MEMYLWDWSVRLLISSQFSRDSPYYVITSSCIGVVLHYSSDQSELTLIKD